MIKLVFQASKNEFEEDDTTFKYIQTHFPGFLLFHNRVGQKFINKKYFLWTSLGGAVAPTAPYGSATDRAFLNTNRLYVCTTARVLKHRCCLILSSNIALSVLSSTTAFMQA